MKTKFSLLFSLIVLFFSIEGLNAQVFLKKLDKNKSNFQESELYQNKNFPTKFELLSIKTNDFQNFLNPKEKQKQKALKLPNAQGGFSSFVIKETSNFEQKLAEKFSMIKSYSAQGIDDPTAIAKISIGTDGFHAVVFSGKEETLYIDPYSKDSKTLLLYKRSDLASDKDDFTCQVEEFSRINTSSIVNTNDGKLRTFRLALACSGEYAQFHLTNQNIPASATDEQKKAAVLSAMNTTMTRVNGVFERDIAVKMVLVGENDRIVFLDADTDNITDGDADLMIDEVQTICDAQIGNANYDIGHVFSIDGSGLAGGGVVCVTGQKARGVTGRSQPIGDAYDIDYVAHEIGHQFGAMHTQNNSCNRNNATAVEPGSASTIMGYAGICSPNVQNNSDAYFHAVSIAEMLGTIQSSATCATVTNTGNTAPIANAGGNFNIPKSTPFVLSGIATDVDGLEGLTYNWEQIDNELTTMPPVASSSGGPMFRSLPSKSTPIRYMPELATVVSGSTSSTWEVVPSVERDLNFSFLVRDNSVGGGSTARDDMKVSVENSEAFTVSLPNSAVTWYSGSTQTITWNKGITDLSPINCQNVNIKLSVDGGVTFPITLKENTPNDGLEDIVVPNNPSTTSRIIVEAADNIFYNVNATNFTINSVTPTFIMTNTSGIQSVCNFGNEIASYEFSFDFVNGFSEMISFTTTDQPSGSIVSFSPTSINEAGNVTMQVSNINGATPQAYTIHVKANSNSVNQNIDVQLNVTNSSFESPNLTLPANGASGIGLSQELKWEADINVSNYDVQVALNSSFTTIISSGNVATNSYAVSGLSENTTYYWRVKPKNSCGEGNYSEAFNFETLIPSYCPSTYTDEAGGGEYITNVTFNTINHDSENDLNDGYEDFTSIMTNIKTGNTYQLSVTFDTDGYQDFCTVFIDWNQNYVFDEDAEMYQLGIGYDDLNTLTSTITVPVDATIGNTRMRVNIEYTSDGNTSEIGACDSDHQLEWGETEDYTLTIEGSIASVVDEPFGDFMLFPNPTKGEFTLALKLISTDNVRVQLFDLRGRLIHEKNYHNTLINFSERIFFKNASAGLYLLKVANGNRQAVKKLIIN